MNEGTARLYRKEVAVNRLLPDDVPAPRLRHSFDEDGWIVLFFDDIDGRQPELPWRLDDFRAALDAYDALVESGAGFAGDLPAAEELLRPDFEGFARLIADPCDDLDPWISNHLADLDALARASLPTIAGDHLCHVDGRSDNLLIASGGSSGDRVWLVDWPWAARGSAWLDVVSLAGTAIFQGTQFDVAEVVEPWVREHGGSKANCTGVWLGMLAYTTDAARRPPQPGMEALRAFHKRGRDALLPIVRQRVEHGLV
ncbi:MAG: phosphotransferase [Micropruina sp.]|nr:phosphotransferase [Micropruina sp.]